MANAHYKWHLNKRLWVTLDTGRDPWLLTLSLPIRFCFVDQNKKPIPHSSWNDSNRAWCKEFERLVERPELGMLALAAFVGPESVPAEFFEPGFETDLFGG